MYIYISTNDEYYTTDVIAGPGTLGEMEEALKNDTIQRLIDLDICSDINDAEELWELSQTGSPWELECVENGVLIRYCEYRELHSICEIKTNDNELREHTPLGDITARRSCEESFPGIEVEIEKDGQFVGGASVEYGVKVNPAGDKIPGIRTFVWGDADNDEPTDIITHRLERRE